MHKKTVQKLIEMLEKDLQGKKISGNTKQTLAKIKLLAFSDISWQPIQKIELVPSDCEYVYDLSVPGYENYVAEGLVVHNSPWPHRLGREFNRIEMKKPCFSELKKALEAREEKKIVLNAGLDPREGKYHETACNNCFSHFSMQQAEQFHWNCPHCKNPIKKGVRDRILELADLKEEKHPLFRPPYWHLLPLAEIIQQALGIENVLAKSVQSKWKDFVERFGNEIAVLVDVPESELTEFDSKTAPFILAFRKGWVHYSPGGGGEYGKPFIALSEKEFAELKANPPERTSKKNNFRGQKTLGEFG
jgi:PHP family Zn ribbon phosphoesterase